MVKKSSKFSKLTKIGAEVSAPEKELNSPSSPPSHYIFISFDLADSTKIKHQLTKLWPEVFRRFFEAFNTFNAEYDDFQSFLPYEVDHWKVQGDEVILRYELTSVEDIPPLIQRTEKLLSFVSNEVKKETLGHIEAYHSHATPYTIPDVKATMWMAEVCTNTKKEFSKECINHTLELPYLGGNGYFEYIGPNIDLGFRISKYSSRGVITLDMTIAWVLLKFKDRFYDQNNFDTCGRLLVKSFVDLKGIWDGNKYPIIWYIPRNYRESVQNAGEFQPIELIQDIANELQIEESLNNHLQKLDSLPLRDIGSHIKEKRDVSNPEVHCVAICFSKNFKYVYLRKRNSSKETNPSVFDCGCVRLLVNQSIKNSLQVSYERDFGLKINVFGKSSPTPVAIYEIKKQYTHINGFIFIGIVEDDSSLKNMEKIAVNTLPKKGDFVPGLKQNIKRALKMLQKR